MSTNEIDALLNEARVFPPSAEWRSNALANDPSVYARAAADPEAFWAGFASELEWIAAVDEGPRLAAAAREVVRRRPAERQRQLSRSPRPHRAPQQGGAHLGRRARRSPHADLFRSPPAGQSVRERPQDARRQEGRSRRALHAARAGARDRDARLRPHRRHPQRRLRRLQRRGAARSHQRLAVLACS